MSIHHKLANFLITYRNTPHTTTGRTPAEVFLKRQPRTRLFLLKPNLAQSVEKKQADQRLYHDKGRVQERELQVDQRVRAKSNAGGLIKWLPGKVKKVCGSRTYLVHTFCTHRPYLRFPREGCTCNQKQNKSIGRLSCTIFMSRTKW